MISQSLARQNTPRLLLIEDNAIIQRSTCLLFGTQGCEIDVAGSGAVASQFYQNKQYDIIILDIGLPDTDGFSVARHIRADSQNQTVPIIVLSAHDKKRQMVGIEDGLIDDYYVKPLTYDLVDAIMAYIQQA